MVSTLLSVPELLDVWLLELGPLEELEPCWDWDLDWEGDRVESTCDGDWVDWVDWTWDGDMVDWAASLGTSSDIVQFCR